MLQNLKLRIRLPLGFITILFFTVIILFIGIYGLKTAGRNLNQFIAGAFTADTAIKSSRIEYNTIARLIRDMALNADESTYDESMRLINDNFISLEENIELLKACNVLDSGQVAGYERLVSNWKQVGNTVITEIMAGNRTGAQSILLEECTPLLDELSKVAEGLENNAIVIQDNALADNLRNSRNSTILMLCLTVVSVVITIVIALRLTSGIVKPIQMVEYAAHELAKGNLNTEIPYTSDNEIGNLSSSMRKSMEILSLYISDIGRAMFAMSNGNFDLKPSQPFIGDFKDIENSIDHFINTMSSTLEQINDSSNQVSNGAEHVAAGAQSLSEGTSRQAFSSEKLSLRVSEISTQVKDTTNSVVSMSKETESVGREVNESNHQMQIMLEAMARINHKANEIEMIIKTIDDIASRTNILALNAAVEAARAGSAGKGFAVVAQEVRNLANKSTDAAQGIALLINDSIKEISAGSEVAKKTAHSLLSVVEGTERIKTSIKEITEASRNQSLSIEQVNLEIEEIVSVIQLNSATAQESAAASEELSGQAALLKGLIEGFQLRKR